MAAEKIANRISSFFVNYFTLTSQLVPQAEAEKSIREGVSFKGMNILILVIAILIASLGLNTNSTAVIIGAMLISPLMGPIIGIGLGVGIHDFELIKRSLRNLLMAAGFSMIASTLYFLISPVSEGHSELLARTSPTIYDVLIGFFGGTAGILAIGSTNKGQVIPGVAIATALMPPLCTAGYGLATWQLNYFFGASYLFIINSIYIAFATFIGVKLLNYKGSSDANNMRARRVMRIVYALAILTMLPSVYLTYNMLRTTKLTMMANDFVSKECRFPSTQVLSSRITTDDGQHTLSITLIGKVLPTDSLELALTPQLRFYGLQNMKLQFIQGDSPMPDNNSNPSTVRDIYQMAQSTITAQQSTIDSLRTIIRNSSAIDALGARIAPELKIVFPQVKEIAITRTLFASTTSDVPDTATVALVCFSSPLPKDKHATFAEYLQARLSIPKVEIVEVDPTLFSNNHNDENSKNAR